MNISFANNAEASTPVEGVGESFETATAPAPPPAAGVPPPPDLLPAVRAESAVGAANPFLGDYLPGFADMILPRLNIIQGLSENPLGVPLGTLVFDKKTALFTPISIDANTGQVKRAASPAVSIAVLGIISKRFVEKVEDGVRGLIVNSEEEVRAAGGTTEYREWELKRDSGMLLFQQMVDFAIVIKRPVAVADDDTVFTFVVGADKYALAAWACKGSAYTEAAKKVLFPARRIGCLREGYPTFHYNLTTTLKKWGKEKQAWVPVLSPAERSSNAFLAFAKEIINA